jgi:hypothetical protein
MPCAQDRHHDLIETLINQSGHQLIHPLEQERTLGNEALTGSLRCRRYKSYRYV